VSGEGRSCEAGKKEKMLNYGKQDGRRIAINPLWGKEKELCVCRGKEGGTCWEERTAERACSREGGKTQAEIVPDRSS